MLKLFVKFREVWIYKHEFEHQLCNWHFITNNFSVYSNVRLSCQSPTVFPYGCAPIFFLHDVCSLPLEVPTIRRFCIVILEWYTALQNVASATKMLSVQMSIDFCCYILSPYSPKLIIRNEWQFLCPIKSYAYLCAIGVKCVEFGYLNFGVCACGSSDVNDFGNKCQNR